MLAVGSDELKGMLGETIVCPHCGDQHQVENGKEKNKDGEMVESSLLQFYKCGDKAFLIGIKGRVIR